MSARVTHVLPTIDRSLKTILLSPFRGGRKFPQIFLQSHYHSTQGKQTILQEWFEEKSYRMAMADLQPGDIVEVRSGRKSRELLAFGFFEPKSSCVHPFEFFSRHSVELPQINEEYWFSKLEAAAKFRAHYIPKCNAYRLLHGGVDGIPGVSIDIYNRCPRVCVETAGALSVLPAIHRYLKSKGYNNAYFHSPVSSGVENIAVTPQEIFDENGVEYVVDFSSDHLFPVAGEGLLKLQHRAIRRLFRDIARQKSAVLDVFGSQGGFASNALLGQAAKVTCFEPRLTHYNLAQETLQRNFHSLSKKVDMHSTDPVEALEALGAHPNASKFDLAVVDGNPAVLPTQQAWGNLLRAVIPNMERNALLMLLASPVQLPSLASRVGMNVENAVQSMTQMGTLAWRAASGLGRELSVLRTFSVSVDYPARPSHVEPHDVVGMILLLQR